MVPSPQQVMEALGAKNVAVECRSCGGMNLKMEVAGVNLTALGAAAVNAATTSQRYVPMALLICGGCGDTRMLHLESLGFRPPY